MVNNPNYLLRPFQSGDEPGVLALWKTAFTSDIPPERFRWKYLATPYDETMMLCVTDQGEIVTFYGGIPYRFNHQGRVTQAVQLMDIMSHPDHRQNKVFIRTARCFISQFCHPGYLLFMYGFPGAAHFAIGESRLGYQKTVPAAYLTVSAQKLSRLAADSAKTDNVGVEPVLTLSPDDPDWLAFWKTCQMDYPFSLIRGPEFIKWRFFDHPEKQYQVVKFVDPTQGKMIGYAVLSKQADKTILVDVLTGDSRKRVAGILSCLGRHLAARGTRTVETWLPENHFLARHALSAGFEQLTEPTGIIPTVALFDHSPSLAWVSSHIFYTMADADLF
jgi:hypothetical protein